MPYSTDSDFSSFDISICQFVFHNKYQTYKYERNTAWKSAKVMCTQNGNFFCEDQNRPLAPKMQKNPYFFRKRGVPKLGEGA